VKTVQRKGQRDRITEDSVKLCQEGIERVLKGAQEELYFEFRDKGSVQKKTLMESLNTL
jgi:hypothetical protein